MQSRQGKGQGKRRKILRQAEIRTIENRVGDRSVCMKMGGGLRVGPVKK
jgi:hypothetical protein